MDSTGTQQTDLQKTDQQKIGQRNSGQQRMFVTLVIIVALIAGTMIFAFGETPKLVFKGVKMRAAQNGSVQALVELHLREFEGVGAGFTMAYDSNYVEPSDYNTNDPAASGVASGVVEINSNAFPKGLIKTAGVKPGELDVGIITDPRVSDEENGEHIIDKKYEIPAETPDKPSTHTGTYKIIKTTTPEGVKIATLSFNVKNPQAFAKLSRQELEGIFKIKGEPSEQKALWLNHIDPSKYYPERFNGTEENLAYEFDIENTIARVTPVRKDSVVSAAAIYERGTEEDLVRYLNDHLRDVVIEYADGAKVLDKITWGDPDKDYKFEDWQHGKTWNVKGGVRYTATQKYNDDISVSVTVKVETVKLTGYKVSKPYAAYKPTAKPTAKKDLELPSSAQLIFDVVEPATMGYVVPIALDSWEQSEPNKADKDFFTSNDNQKYKFTAAMNNINAPQWATIEADSVSVYREVSDVNPPTLDQNNVTAVVQDDGTLVITVKKVGGVMDFPTGTDFEIKMPNGEVIDKNNYTGPRDVYKVDLNDPANGMAKITIKNGNVDYNEAQKRLQTYINLGNRVGEYSMSVEVPNMPKSNEIPFSTVPRKNIYTGGNDAGGAGYAFDYSDTKKDLMKFHAGDTLNTTVRLWGEDRVTTTYAGDIGREPGALNTVKVDAWTLESGDPNAEGSIVVYKGQLSTTTYAGYGQVQNEDAKYIKLSLYVEKARPDEEKIEMVENIPDYTFDTQRTGYGKADLREKEFTITNTGETDIRGLSLDINSDEFIVLNNPVYYLKKGESTTFSIIPKVGLTTGSHVAEVTIKSNRTAELSKFRITQNVEDKDLFRVEVRSNDPKMGTAKVLGGYTYSKGATVTIEATPLEKNVFVKWSQMHSGDLVQFAGETSANTTFKMPGNDVIIIAEFASSELYTFEYGNSPYGLIMRDDSLSADDKREYKESFDNNKNSFIDGKVPSGGTAGIRYREDAWGEKGKVTKNYDKDENALFIYSGENFTDPGLKDVKKTDGSAVQQNEVTRRITVDVIDPGTYGSLHDQFKSCASRVIQLGMGYDKKEMSELSALIIRPGVYQMEYEYEDAPGHTTIAVRPVIVLSKLGDVNLSKTTDTDDAKCIYDRYKKRMPYERLGEYVANARLYKYRVCDVNGDGNVNAVDAHKIEKSSNSLKQYYMRIN